MNLPKITITIEPVNDVTVANVSVTAEWKSSYGTQRTIRHVTSVAYLDDFLGDLIYEMFDTIKAVEAEDEHGATKTT